MSMTGCTKLKGFLRFLSVVVLPTALATIALAAGQHDTKSKAEGQSQATHLTYSAGDLKWKAAPPALPEGAQVAILSGDPKQHGPFTMRVRFPENYRIPPHWHPADEHVTVIQGDFNMGFGEKFDTRATHKLEAGGFAFMKTGTRHYAHSTEGAIVQIHGMGPWDIIYVNASDDPRQGKPAG